VKAKSWPNGLGWDVGTTAEVWKLKDGLGVRVITRSGKVKALFIPDLSVDPVDAVRRCRNEGKVIEE
jgi:hypothetical protein